MSDAPAYIHTFAESVTPTDVESLRNTHGDPESCPDCRAVDPAFILPSYRDALINSARWQPDPDTFGDRIDAAVGDSISYAAADAFSDPDTHPDVAAAILDARLWG
jgi:hypothetical protein